MYWEQDQEITLLWSILEPLDPETDAGTADTIICSLIDMELVNCDKAPVAQHAWQNDWEGYDVTREFVAKHYVDEDDLCGDAGCYRPATRHVYPYPDEDDGTYLVCDNDGHYHGDIRGAEFIEPVESS